MIPFFRKIRRVLIDERQLSKYLLYATGEIILVVIGILIALQINNQNDAHKQRQKELKYLQNISTDIENNIVEMDRFLEKRGTYLTKAGKIIEHLEGKPVEDWRAFTEECISIWSWQRFYQVNYTFQELSYSGNLALISNDTIKNMLLQLESMYKKTKAEEDHFRFDSEELLFKPIYNLMNLNPLIKSHMGQEVELTRETFGEFFTDNRVINGFLMVLIEFSTMNQQLKEMRGMSGELLATIKREMSRA